MLARDVAVLLADGVSRRHGVIGQLVVLGDLAHQIRRRLPARQLFTKEGMEHRAGGVERLQIVLDVQRLKNVGCEVHRQVRRVRVVRGAAVARRRNDVGITRDVVLCKAVGRRLCGRRLKVIQVAVLLLIIGKALAHVIEHILW